MFNFSPSLHTYMYTHTHIPHSAPDCGPFFSRLCLFLSSRRRLIIRTVILVATLLVLYHGISYFCTVTEFSKHVDPNAVAGYFYCRINQTQVTQFDQKYACDFSPQPNPSDVIVVTFINSAWVSLSKNWICSAEKVGLKDKLFLVGFEPNVCSEISDVPCYEHPGVSISGTSFGKPAYQKMMIERTRIILKLLSCGKRIALVDADITFLKNPFEYLDEIMEDKDIVFQTDSSGVRVIDSVLSYFFRYICGGFIYMRSNDPIKHLWLSVLQYQSSFKWNDQAGLNICIRHHSQKVRWNVLDSIYFPNGRQYFFYNQSNQKNLIVHANHLEGANKLIRMIAADVWCDPEYGKKICSDPPNFHEHCIPKDSDLQIEAEKRMVEEAVRNAVERHKVDTKNQIRKLKEPNRKKWRPPQDKRLVPEWCEKFVSVCRTKFGVDVLL